MLIEQQATTGTYDAWFYLKAFSSCKGIRNTVKNTSQDKRFAEANNFAILHC